MNIYLVDNPEEISHRTKINTMTKNTGKEQYKISKNSSKH